MNADAIGPNVAGTWYPADAQALARQVDRLLAQARLASGTQRDAGAVIAPHAGFAYSGTVAARGLNRLAHGASRRVVLIGPSHYVSFPGAAVPSSSVYRTPLGDVPLDREAIEMLGRAPGVRVDSGPFLREHALEAEIPFLQRSLRPGWRLLPVLVGMLGPEADAATVARALRPFVGGDTPVVVSSDFTHFGPRFEFVPFDREVPARIEALDMGAVERILAWDRDGFDEYVRRTGATICGRNAIRVLLDLFPDSLDGELEAYDTSGRITGEWDHSVSYASLVFKARRTLS